ncbi:hypothetical protein F5I97DRAFT_135327 [Phlebopus sp. FC_14]|nr:hypothetical protein F5I97DRAFT_135327 [Phlebopus sp. FC_14]
MSSLAQGWHPNPQLMQPSLQPPPVPPAGWTGSWPPASNIAFPPGYPGPPPMPNAGIANPRWNAGYWQYNPHANMQNAHQPWAPGMGWAFPANHNPYKRVPRPASPSYWNTKLSDNGLGLEGMVKRKEREPGEDNGDEPKTPWIWNPPSLLDSSGDRATPTRDFGLRRSGSQDSAPRSTSTPTRDYVNSSRRQTQDGQGSHTQIAERSTPVRPDYFYSSRSTPQDNHQSSSSLARHHTDPSDARLSGPASAGISAHQASTPGRSGSWPSKSRSQPPAPIQVPPYPGPNPTPTHSAGTGGSGRPHQQPVLTQEPESYISRQELQPTFSANIVRTPTHYQQSRRSVDTSHSPSTYGNTTSTPSRVPPGPEPLARQFSLPTAAASSRDVYSSFTEDHSRSLSPTTSTPTRASVGSLSRSRTEPVLGPNLSTIPESFTALSNGELFIPPLQAPPSSDEESPEPSPRPRSRRSPYAQRISPQPSPRHHDPRPSPYASRHSPPSYSTRRENPLPPPPVERPNLAASQPPVQEPPPATYSRKVRMGLWNKRGDHLTPNSYVVYAPEDCAYPEELRDYPNEMEGYKDQFDTFVPWLRERPELPASLPCRGRPPIQPYDSFVVYTYLP